MSAIFLGALAAVFVVLAIYLVHATAILTKIELDQAAFPGVRVAYQRHLGHYRNTFKVGQALDAKLSAAFKDVNWAQQPLAGVFYDKPGSRPDSELRSAVGRVLPAGFDEAPADGIVYGEIPKMPDALVVKYPYKGFLSVIAGIKRVYPLFDKFWAERSMRTGSGAIAELYGWNGPFITYVQGARRYDGLMAGFPE
jgi:hypothetical protein